ncbi:zinc finger BED domain-containing protein 4-like [Amphiprion ocellaris]|uniref:zinc finger BED domain-containing protein 4-like n=1 Tax=Amphiprion ocellaris TaxID=80972 RepID=UPI0024115509|nr:zinc finger BED domain-containing protein 4-like [Amphiprion ocellaris]
MYCCCVCLPSPCSTSDFMDRSNKMKFSPVWNHFDLLTANKVKCWLCSTELSYINKSTSSMLKHYRAQHGNEELADTCVSTPVPNKQAVDEAVVNMIIKDCQPLTIVGNEGFRELLKLIAPSYVLPSRKAIKDLVIQKYEEEKEKTKMDLQSVVAISLTADMWTSINMKAYLAVTCHYVDKESHELRSSVLGVQHFPQRHTVSGSNVIPLMRMIHIEFQRQASTVTKTAAQQLAENLRKRLTESICNLESLSVMTLATLLDPRFKTVGFFSPLKATEAVKRLKSECAAEMRSHEPDPAGEEPSSSHGSEPSSGHNLWKPLDMEVEENNSTSNTTAGSIVEVQRYLAETNTPRAQDPLQYWKNNQKTYPHLYQLALKFLCTPSSSVPCERVFSQAGELMSKKRNRLGAKTLQKLLFLNKSI